MENDGTVWRGEYVALPSAVRVAFPKPIQPSNCERDLGEDTGGLLWRFGVFIGVMIVWAVGYQRWVARTPERDA